MNTLIAIFLILTGAYTFYCSDVGIEVVENTEIISQQGDEHKLKKIEKLSENLNINIDNILNIDKEEIERFLNNNKDKIKIMMNFLKKRNTVNNKDINKSNKNIDKNKEEYISFIVHKENCTCSLEKTN